MPPPRLTPPQTRTRMRTAWVAAVLAAGCSGTSHPNASHPATSHPPAGQPTSATSQPPSTCPPGSRGPNGSGAAVDYVDFIQAFDQQYIAGLDEQTARAPVKPSDLGDVVMRSRCSYSQLSDHYGVVPRGQPQNGDTAFLPPGTPIYAVNGWSTHCRLAATSDGRLRVYLAYRNGTSVATPKPCALSH